MTNDQTANPVSEGELDDLAEVGRALNLLRDYIIGAGGDTADTYTHRSAENAHARTVRRFEVRSTNRPLPTPTSPADREMVEGLRVQRDFEGERANRLAAFIRESGLNQEYEAWCDGAPPKCLNLASRPGEVERPDYYYIFDHWDCTYEYDLISEIAGYALDGDIKSVAKLGALKTLAPRWIANVPVDWDEFGDPQEWEPQVFESEDAARRAMIAAAPAHPDVEAAGWMPIETMPHADPITHLVTDGRTILLGGRSWTCTGKRTDNEFWHGQPGSGWNPAYKRRLTHWMPLPAAPAHPDMGGWGVIKLTTYDGREQRVAIGAVASYTEASPSSAWHGTRAFVKLFDGSVLEVRETVAEIDEQLRVAGA